MKGLKEQDIEPLNKFIEALENGRKAQLIAYGTVAGTGCNILKYLKIALIDLKHFVLFANTSYLRIYKEAFDALNKVQTAIWEGKKSWEYTEFLGCFIDEFVVYDFTKFLKNLMEQIINNNYIETELNRKHYTIISDVLFRLIKAQMAINDQGMEEYLETAYRYFQSGVDND